MSEPAADSSSLTVNASLGNGSKISGSVLSNVQVERADVSGCVMVGVTARKVTGKGFLLYNVVDDSEEGIVMSEGEVRADVFIPGHKGKISMRTNYLKLDSGKNWKVQVDGNEYSFEQIYEMNFGVDVAKAFELARTAHQSLAGK